MRDSKPVKPTSPVKELFQSTEEKVVTETPEPTLKSIGEGEIPEDAATEEKPPTGHTPSFKKLGKGKKRSKTSEPATDFQEFQNLQMKLVAVENDRRDARHAKTLKSQE